MTLGRHTMTFGDSAPRPDAPCASRTTMPNRSLPPSEPSHGTARSLSPVPSTHLVIHIRQPGQLCLALEMTLQQVLRRMRLVLLGRCYVRLRQQAVFGGHVSAGTHRSLRRRRRMTWCVCVWSDGEWELWGGDGRTRGRCGGGCVRIYPLTRPRKPPHAGQ